MRKIIGIGLVVFIIVAAGGFVASWYLQASQIKSNVEATIARINAKQQYITYQSIETSGFPSDVIVSIVNPRFAGRVDTLIKDLEQDAQKSGAPLTGPDGAPLAQLSTLPEWSEDVTLNGHITLGVNAVSDTYTLTIHGNWVSNGKIGAQAIAMERTGGEDTTCRMEMARGNFFSTLWDFSAFANDPSRFASDFRLFDCVIPSSTIADRNTKETIMQWGAGRIYASSQPAAGDQRQIRFHLKNTDSEVLPKGDAVFDAYLGLIRAVDPFFYYPKVSSFGKQNIEIDLSYTGPADMKSDFQNANVDIHLDKFNFSSNLSSSNGSLVFTKTADAGGNQAGKAGFRFETTVGQQYDAYIRDYARFLITQLYAHGSQKPEFLIWKPAMDKYTAEEMYAIIYPIIPNFQYLGKLVQALDVSYQLDKSMAAGDVTLSVLDFSTTPYGLTGQGSAKQTPGQLFPNSNTRLSCRNCLKMVDDIFDYALRFKTVMSYFKPEEAATMPISLELAQATKDFLDRLAEKNPSDLATLHYTIVSDPAQGVNVNGKNIMEVMALYEEHVGPALQGPAKKAN
jgi:hypothetical protein